MNSDVQRLPRYCRLPLIAREDKWDGGGMTYTTWYHLMYWYDMIWYDMIPDNVIWCQWIICCTIWCSLVFIYLLVFDIHIDYLTWPYYHLINEYRLKKCTADFVTGSWSISQNIWNVFKNIYNVSMNIFNVRRNIYNVYRNIVNVFTNIWNACTII